MAARDTKQKILGASLNLFNANGISNVRLQQIADETGISVGNLAYHFNSKEAIIVSLVSYVIGSLQDLLRHCSQYASLRDLDFLFKEFYRLYARYGFFNLDIVEIKRNFPTLYELLQPLFIKTRVQLEKHFNLWLQQCLIQEEANTKDIASNVWLMLFFMPADAQISEKNTLSENQYRRRLWNYIASWFTVKGSAEYSSMIEPGLRG